MYLCWDTSLAQRLDGGKNYQHSTIPMALSKVKQMHLQETFYVSNKPFVSSQSGIYSPITIYYHTDSQKQLQCNSKLDWFLIQVLGWILVC